MSSEPTPATPMETPSSPGVKSGERIVIYRHSNLFYWWPVWFLGFLFAGITYFDDQRLAVVPANTVALENVAVDLDGKGVLEKRHILVLDKSVKGHRKQKLDDDTEEIVQPTIYVSHLRTLGSIYTVVLLIVITITSISIRGLWTVFVLVSLVMLTIIFAAAGWWETIFQKLNQLSIFINMGGYLLISTVLFVMWLVNFVALDRQTYLIFAPSQVRVRVEIGGEETVYDTIGIVVQKQRADLFRHWILGFGSGDLIIKPVGESHPIEFPNVLFVGSKVKKIERMIKEKEIVRASPEPRPA